MALGLHALLTVCIRRLASKGVTAIVRQRLIVRARTAAIILGRIDAAHKKQYALAGPPLPGK